MARILLAAALLALAYAAPSPAQCRSGRYSGTTAYFTQACPDEVYRPRDYRHTAPGAVVRYTLVDSSGQRWEAADPVRLRDFVARRNAAAATPAPVGDSPLASPQAPAPPAPGPRASAGDPYDFGSWLNSVRAASGLRPLAYDPALSADAAANSSMGFHHSHLGRARRQDVGTAGTLRSIEAAWLRSPAHLSAILDPSATRYGIAHVGGVWTYSAY